MATDIVERLKGAPAMEPTDGDPFVGTAAESEPEPARGPRGGRNRATPERERARERRARNQPFAAPDEPQPPASASLPTARGVTFTPEMAAQLRVLWDDYEQKQHTLASPKTMSYRCLGYKNDGTLCGAVIEGGTYEERLKTGEVLRCPHGPDAALAGVLFDRERFPQHHHELTPMDPIL